jgi:spermidine/putrescine transport system permease protein
MAVEAAPGAGAPVVEPERAAGSPGPRGGARRADRARAWALGLWSGLALLYLFIPIFIVVLFSFNAPKGRFNFTWQGFTLAHWAHPFADPDLAAAMKNSLAIALIATLIATALGTFMAMALVRYGFRGRTVVDFFVFLPLSTPEVVMGASLLALFLTMGVNTGFATIVIAHVMFTVSYVVTTVKARLEGMDRHIEEAAMDLGATEWATFRKVTLPMIAPGVAAAALLAAAISVDDYVITSFNAGQTVTFPLFIFGATRQGVPPEVNVLATGLLVVVLILMGLNVVVQRRLARRDAVRQAAAMAGAA